MAVKRLSINLFIVTICAAFTIQTFTPSCAGTLSEPFPAAEFHHNQAKDWINSEPLMLNDLKGKVVLLDFWTFDCWNCYRSFPWMKKSGLPVKREGSSCGKWDGDRGQKVIWSYSVERNDRPCVEFVCKTTPGIFELSKVKID